MKDPNDSYQVDYEEITWVQVLIEGNWNGYDYDREFMENMAESYNPDLIRANLIVDHKWKGPAFGHVLELNVEDNPSDLGGFHLMARVGFMPEGKRMVESGEYNERSVGWSSWYPTHGLPYLWEVSLLGANTPAVSGMDPIVFSDEDTQDMAVADMAEATELASQPQFVNLLQMKAQTLIWDQTENYIRYRVRQPSRFRNRTFRTVALSDEKGIWSVQGKLKSTYVPEGNDPNSMVIQAILFSREEKHNWTLKRAKTWVKGHQDDLEAATSGGETKVIVMDADGAFIAVDESEATILEGDVEPVTSGAGIVTLTTEVSNNEGGQTLMPDTQVVESDQEVPDPVIEGTIQEITNPDLKIVQPESAEAVAEENERLRQRVDRMNAQALASEQEHNVALLKQQAATRRAILKSKVYALQTQGFIAPAQVDFGLVEALLCVPEDATVIIGTKKVAATDVILEIMKHGGQLKLKHEFTAKLSVEEGVAGADPDADLDKLEADGSYTDTERIKRRLAKENPKWTETELIVEAMKLAQGGATS